MWHTYKLGDMTLKVTSKNAIELGFSIGIWVSGIVVGSVAPMDLPHVLILGGSQIVAFFCALNAVLDFRRFKLFGRVFCIAWFSFMAILTPFALWSLSMEKFWSRM